MTTEEIMNIYSILQLCGGLAFFLFGMHVMSGSLEKLAGGNLQKILKGLTSNPAKSLFFGAVITIAIQSSSALTVMLVGLVNSGIMELGQTVGVIMGSNIGTTLTAWILSLSGIQSESIFISLLKPENFSPIVALIGVIMIMGAKSEKKKDAGVIMAGFAVLMYGMQLMSGAVSPLADMPEFTSILTTFNNPLIGVLTGAVFTGVIQSSAASVGVLQALAMTGAISYGMAIPIIMGQNIGTCVTAMISAIGAKKNAKRAALVHLYFNIIGTLVFMCLFYLINAFIHFEFLSQGATPVGIATIHSVFNIFATIILLPFGKGLEKLACLSVRDDKEREETIDANRDFDLLDERFLDKTSLAMEHCRMVTNNMADLSREALFKSLDLFSDFSEEKAGDVCDIEERVDKYEDVLGTYLMKLSSRDLTEQDSETLNMLLHCIGNFERISDHACNLVNAAREMFDKNMHFSEKAALELRIFTEAVRDIVNMAFDAFKAEDINEATKVEPLEEVIDDLNMELKARHIRRLREGKCTIELGFVHSDIITNYERIADHCSNIGVCIIEIKQEGFETHEYLGIMKREDNEQFRKQYALYKEKYKLPETRKFTENDMQPAAVKA